MSTFETPLPLANPIARRILILPPCITRYWAISSPIWQDTSCEPIHVELGALRFVKPRRLRPSQHPCGAELCAVRLVFAWLSSLDHVTSRRIALRSRHWSEISAAKPLPRWLALALSLSPFNLHFVPTLPRRSLSAYLPVPYPPSLGLHSNHAQRAQLESSSRNRTSAAPIWQPHLTDF